MSELNEIASQINKTTKDVIRLKSSRQQGVMHCKAADDLHFNTIQELEHALAELKTTRSEMHITMFNTFELNTPCTIEYVMSKVGLPHSAMSAMIEQSDFINEYDDILYESYIANISEELCKTPASHITEIDFISQTELTITKYYTYSVHQNKCRIKLPNWRFVQSKDSSIYYVERYEP